MDDLKPWRVWVRSRFEGRCRVDSSPDTRLWDPTFRHFVACGVLPVGLLLARFGPVFPLTAIDYSRFEVVQEPILFGFLFALPLGGFTSIEYRRCVRASLLLAAGYLFCFLLKDQFVNGWPLRAVRSNSYPTFLMRVFILLFTGEGLFFAVGFLVGIGASLGYWLSGIAWWVRRRRLKA